MKLMQYALLLVAILSFAGCDKGKSSGEEASKVEASGEEGESAESDEPKTLGEAGLVGSEMKGEEKAAFDYWTAYDKYLKIQTPQFVNSGRPFEDSLERFQKQKLEEWTAKKGKRARTYFPNEAMREFEAKLEAGVKGNIDHPKYAVFQTAAKKCLDALQKFNQINDDLTSYVKTRAFLDDDFEKGRAMAQTFTPQAQAMIDGCRGFAISYTEFNAALRQRDADNLGKEGQHARKAAFELMSATMQASSILLHQNIEEEATRERFDQLITEISSKLEKFKSEFDKMTLNSDQRLTWNYFYDQELEALGHLREAKAAEFSRRSVKRAISSAGSFGSEFAMGNLLKN